MVGDRQCGLLEFQGPGYEIIDPVGAVEERVFGVTMQMNEGHPVRIGDVRCRQKGA